MIEKISEAKTASFSFNSPFCVTVKEYSAEDVKSVRKKFGISQTTLSLKTGIPVSTIQAWESGRRKPSASARFMLERLAEAT